jgi:outer membrane protein TolC
LLDDARALRAAGMAVDADVLGAEARAAAARLDVVRTQTERSNRLSDLRSLLGLAGDAELELADRGTRELPPRPAALGELLAAASESRPELAIADARVAELSTERRSPPQALPGWPPNGTWRAPTPATCRRRTPERR